MKFISGSPAGIISDASEVVEIKLWEAYLLNDRHNILQALNYYAIDLGPVENGEASQGRIVYRFHAGDWENHIKGILYENRIPVVIHNGAMRADRSAKSFRQPVLVY